MNALTKPKLFTVAEFLEWADQQGQGKYEFHDGVIVALAPERLGHAQSKTLLRKYIHIRAGRQNFAA